MTLLSVLPGLEAEEPHVAHLDQAIENTSGEVIDRQTRRWYGVSSFALLALGLGVLTSQPGLLLASALGLAFAGYGHLTEPPAVDLHVDRTVGDESPEPGDDVTVTVTVRNDSDRPLFDLRLVGGVPARLRVVDGTPRLGTALRPDGSVSFSYVVTASRGVHTFDPVTVVLRDASGATERVTTVGERDSLSCEPTLPTPSLSFPLRSQTSQFNGRFPADSGGPGVEFYATREYERGDPLSRIDWKRTARTGDLTTVEYRVERTATVVLVVDARQEAYVAADTGSRSAVERAIEAAGEVASSLLADGHAVGVTAMSPHDCWLPPARGDTHRVEVSETLATHPAFSPVEPSGEANVYQLTQRIRRRLASDVQLVVFSPLADAFLAESVVRLNAHGHLTTVVSPDPTATDSPGHRLSTVERTLRLGDLRRRGVPVVDWDADESFPRALAGSRQWWSK